jgi:hypothetical protein
MLIDIGNEGEVGRGGVPDFERGHALDYFCPAKKKSPGRKAGA